MDCTPSPTPESSHRIAIQPLRIAVVLGEMGTGGVENVVMNYYRHIDRSKVQFDFYVHEHSKNLLTGEIAELGGTLTLIPNYSHVFRYYKKLVTHFRQKQYKIVHVHLNTMSVFAQFAAWRAGVPIRITHNHSVPGAGDFSRNAMKYILRLAAKWFATDYFACTEKAGRWLFGDKEYDNGNVKLVRNAIDFDRFSPNEEIVSALRKQLNLEDRFVVGHVGRLTYAKNHTFLLDIFAQIKKQRPDSILLLVGDGELYDVITAKIRSLELEDSVILVGSVSDPENYYPLSDVILLPSVFEGMPVTSIESQIVGTPILVSEAIPDEATISNGFQKLSLSSGAKLWATSAIELASREVELHESSTIYNIREAAPILTQWYLEKLKSI